MVTATEILDQHPRTVQVIPITSNVARRMRTELPLRARCPDRESVAQTHLIATVPTDTLTGETYEPVATELAQIRERLADQLDIP